MSIQLRTIWQLGLALLFVALAALALMGGPGGQAGAETEDMRSVTERNRVGTIERLDPDVLSSLDRG